MGIMEIIEKHPGRNLSDLIYIVGQEIKDINSDLNVLEEMEDVCNRWRQKELHSLITDLTKLLEAKKSELEKLKGHIDG